MLSMTKRTTSKLNWLERHLPEGLVVDASWLSRHGYSTSLRSQYVVAGWLEQPARRVYRRCRGALSWQQVVISLQTLLEYPLEVGGRTALELQGYAHYLPHTQKEVHLYGPKQPPRWIHELRLGLRFVYHNDRRLFPGAPIPKMPAGLDWSADNNKSAANRLARAGLTVQPWGQWGWPLVLSTPERAVLELLDELPNRESFHQADMLMQGLTNLSPRRLQQLLAHCRSVKVKRLFFFFADRHEHAWLQHLDVKSIDFGTGKRMLVKGGKLDPVRQITVPEEFHGLR
jgi:Transcriptional regulator, AbiEi antitoxin, Type IV TA system/Transcriptional regulator, AbiEi antitoxin N-terminal domain